MEGANVELVRSIFADWERGAFDSVEWADPQMEFVRVDGPRPGSRTGAADWRAALRALIGRSGTYRAETTGYRELDDERVLVLTQSAPGRDDTWVAPLDLPPAWPVWRRALRHGARRQKPEGAALFQIRNRKVIRLAVYSDRTRAFSDLGVER